MDMQYLLLAVLAGGVVALLYALVRARWIDRQPAGEEALRRISGYISQGAMTFLGREYRALVPFVIVAGGFLAAVNWGRLSFQGLSFAAGPAAPRLPASSGCGSPRRRTFERRTPPSRACRVRCGWRSSAGA